jgi:dipeptidyl aminopeptidase/acylaminoacyl peptidase
MRNAIAKAVLALAIVVGVMQVGTAAQASFPGTNGLIAYVSGGNVFVVNPANPVPTQVTNTGNFTRVRYNAAGNKLVSDQVAGLVLLDPVAGSAVTLVPNTVGGDTRPAFSPDGSKLVFNRNTGLFTIGIDGTNRTSILNSAAATQPEWSADGSFIAFANFPTSIRRISPTGGNLTTLATTGPGGTACSGAAPCQTPSISPDSTKVSYNQQNVANGGLAFVNANGTSVTPSRLTTGATDSRGSYAPDGTKLVFARNQVLSTVPSDGSGTVTPLGAINGVTWTSWGSQPGVGTGTGDPGVDDATYSVAAPSGKVKSGACIFTINASTVTTGDVDFTVSVNGKNTPSPASGTVVFSNQSSAQQQVEVKHTKKQHGDVSLTLTSATGGTVGSPASATCDVGKK